MEDKKGKTMREHLFPLDDPSDDSSEDSSDELGEKAEDNKLVKDGENDGENPPTNYYEETLVTWRDRLFPRDTSNMPSLLIAEESIKSAKLVPKKGIDAGVLTNRGLEDDRQIKSPGNDGQKAGKGLMKVGTPIGLRVTQSVVKAATQSSLSFFHIAGMEMDIKTGPSISDTMDSKYYTENTGMQFKAKEGVSLNTIRKGLVGKRMDYFVEKVRDPRISPFNNYDLIWYNNLPAPNSVLRLYISFSKLLEFDLTLEELATRCFGERHCDNNLMWSVSPDFMGIIDCHITLDTVKPLSRLQTMVCGSEKILDAFFHPLYDSISSATVSTVGSDIMTASCLDFVQEGTISSNNAKEAENCLGIEAAAFALRSIIYTDPEGIIPDFMTRNGRVCAFNKSSVEVQRKGLLTSLGFERPRDDIKRIALSEDEVWDKHPSVYSNIMTGTNPEYCLVNKD